MSTDTQGFPFSQYAARLAEYKQTIQRKAGAGLGPKSRSWTDSAPSAWPREREVRMTDGWDDAADSTANDLDDEDTTSWIPRVVYLPWAISGDLPGPDDVLPKHPHLADQTDWAIVLCGSEDGQIEVAEEDLTLAQALDRV